MKGSKIVEKGRWSICMVNSRINCARVKVCASGNHFTNKQKYKYIRYIQVQRLMLQGLGHAEAELAGN